MPPQWAAATTKTPQMLLLAVSPTDTNPNTLKCGYRLMEQNPQSQLKLLVQRGKEQGYLTYAEVNDHLPEDIVDSESDRRHHPDD